MPAVALLTWENESQRFAMQQYAAAICGRFASMCAMAKLPEAAQPSAQAHLLTHPETFTIRQGTSWSVNWAAVSRWLRTLARMHAREGL